MSGIIAGFYWGTDSLMLGFLYWGALVLIKDHQIDLLHMMVWVKDVFSKENLQWTWLFLESLPSLHLWLKHYESLVYCKICFFFICYVLFTHYCCRSRRIGSSLSASQVFFDLFDRIPTIDNTSNRGKILVREPMKFHLRIDLFRKNFVGKFILIKLNLLIQHDQQRVFLTNLNWLLNPVRFNWFSFTWNSACIFINMQVNVLLSLVCFLR